MKPRVERMEVARMSFTKNLIKNQRALKIIGILVNLCFHLALNIKP